MSDSEYRIAPMSEADLPRYIDLQTRAFRAVLKQFLGKVPPGEPGDRIRKRFYRPDCTILALWDQQGVIQAVLPLQKCGSRSIPGPLAISAEFQKPWKEGIAEALVGSLMRLAVQQGCARIDSTTFPHSQAHFNLYWQFGIPLFQAPMVTKRLASESRPASAAERFSQYSPSEQTAVLDTFRQTTHQISTGLDVSADFRHVHKQGIGESLVVRQAGRPIGFAICHFGDGSEVYRPDQLLIKQLAVDPRADQPARIFQELLAAVEGLASQQGLQLVSGMVSTGRIEAVNSLTRCGYHITEIDQQWFMMPPSTQGLASAGAEDFRPEHFALADWR